MMYIPICVRCNVFIQLLSSYGGIVLLIWAVNQDKLPGWANGMHEIQSPREHRPEMSDNFNLCKPLCSVGTRKYRLSVVDISVETVCISKEIFTISVKRRILTCCFRRIT